MFDTIDASIASGTKWRMIMNQIVFGTVAERYTSPNPATADYTIDWDAWDGYQAQRQRILQKAYNSSWTNTFFVAGDSHANWLFENRLDNVLRGTNDPTNLTAVDISTTPADSRGTLVEFGCACRL